MKVILERRKTEAGGTRQVWVAYEQDRDYLGRGRTRIAAIRDLGPAERFLNHPELAGRL